MPDDMLTMSQTRRLLGISERTLKRLVAEVLLIPRIVQWGKSYAKVFPVQDVCACPAYTVGGAARQLGIHVDTLRKYIKWRPEFLCYVSKHKRRRMSLAMVYQIRKEREQQKQFRRENPGCKAPAANPTHALMAETAAFIETVRAFDRQTRSLQGKAPTGGAAKGHAFGKTASAHRAMSAKSAASYANLLHYESDRSRRRRLRRERLWPAS